MTGAFTLPAAAAVLAASFALGAVPPEVPPDAVFGADRATLSWSSAAGAATYDVYRGTAPAVYDHACRVYRTGAVSAVLAEDPAPGSLFYYVISGVNPDGEGTLGPDGSGAARPNATPCVDVDADLVADNLDNCPAAPNPGQADQDGNAVGDVCDPNTYDFEADVVGARPAQMTQLGPLGQSLTVKSVDGERGVSYDLAGVGTSDRFDRLSAGLPLQDTTVWIDVQDAPQVASLELWSDGAWGWNAGNGVILQFGADQTITFYDRHGQTVPAQQGPAVPVSGRLRIRLVKGPAATSAMHVDAFDGASWIDDDAVFPIADDHRYTGLGTVAADYSGGPRAIKRITATHAVPATSLVLRKDPSWSTDWKLFQRDVGNFATVPVRAYYRSSDPVTFQARVVPAGGGAALPGHDWTDHQTPLAASDGVAVSLDLAGVPAGGNYDVETRLVRTSDAAVIGQDALREIAVGDVFLAGGQSNMSGYSGSLAGAEAPTDLIHLFGNDYVWKRASEPMDDGTDQVDLVSVESPAHTLMLRFAKEIQQAVGVPVAIIPGPLGGTNLYSQWQRDAADHDNRGTLYGSLLYRSLVQSFGAPPKGFLWYQGESDAGRGTALYKQDLLRLMAQYREDLGNPDLWFGIVQLATYDAEDFTTWLPIQEAHRQIAVEDPHAVMAVAVDQPRADVIHLNVDGYKTVGMRLAKEMLEHAYGQPITASARLTQARIVGNSRKIELVYDGNVTGGSTALYRVVNGAATINVTSVAVATNVITLSLHARVDPGALVSYGYSKSPIAAWVRDTAGTAVAAFHSVPAQ